MADERNRWLDKAAAERVLRGGPAVPGGDPSARAAEARLRTALELLAAPQACAGAELPGEAAAVAAFRAARGGAEVPAASGPSAVSGTSGTSGSVGGDTSPLVELGRVLPLGAPVSPARRGRPVRFGLVAALASVAVGGLAVAAGAGLLDRGTHDSAGPAPAVSLSADENPTPPGDSGGPTPGPPLRPTPFRGADGVPPTQGGGPTPGGLDSGAVQGFGPGTGTGPGAASGGGSGRDGGDGKDAKDGTDGKDALAGGTTSLKDADRQTRLKAVELCEAYRSGRMNSDRRDKLSKLAKGLARIPHFCEELLDGAARSTTPTVPRGSDLGGDVLKAPTLAPASPGISAPARLPSR
ncbi:hypothetical protein EDE04_2720 [Streptomyces sp. 2132.2]|uniref:hypothetical protein n=1 Tax=Streptomyces sp. 2132.2 TaxID=2485161 RepID=UPI000F48555F|nr:hypothetical protein [Streptomyces sp. 2132.2]ROQ96261.1 hypothetical protein EDE04_2720 [Streptomyces sp. 2132.2]